MQNRFIYIFIYKHCLKNANIIKVDYPCNEKCKPK